MLEALVQRLSVLSAKVSTKPDTRWGVVTGTSPLRVQLDAADAPLLGSPSTLVAGLANGDRVLCLIQHLRVTVIGKGQGNPEYFREQVLSGLTWPGAGQGWMWTAGIRINFPIGTFTKKPLLGAVHALHSQFICFSTVISVDKDGFTIRLLTLGASAIPSVTLTYSAHQR